MRDAAGFQRSGRGSPHSRQGRRRSTRRSVASTAALLVAAGTLAACGSDDGGASTLTWYINPDSGGQASGARPAITEGVVTSLGVLGRTVAR